MHGLEPQTLESLGMLRKGNTPFVVALNKIDRLFDWRRMPTSSVKEAVKKQNRNTKDEFDERVRGVVTEFAEQVCRKRTGSILLTSTIFVILEVESFVKFSLSLSLSLPLSLSLSLLSPLSLSFSPSLPPPGSQCGSILGESGLHRVRSPRAHLGSHGRRDGRPHLSPGHLQPEGPCSKTDAQRRVGGCSLGGRESNF